MRRLCLKRRQPRGGILVVAIVAMVIAMATVGLMRRGGHDAAWVIKGRWTKIQSDELFDIAKRRVRRSIETNGDEGEMKFAWTADELGLSGGSAEITAKPIDEERWRFVLDWQSPDRDVRRTRIVYIRPSL